MLEAFIGILTCYISSLAGTLGVMGMLGVCIEGCD
jgi:hypothetical protein